MTDTQKKKSSGFIPFILAALLLTVVIILYFQNHESINLTLFSSRVEIQLNLLILSCIIVGFLLGAIVMIPGRWRLYMANRRLKKEIKQIKPEPKDTELLTKS
jgi:uncharacterized integral membrane protein